ncbi:MAG: choice-of-anchor L domain-containing protein, partial [Bacteroidota bacterium]
LSDNVTFRYVFASEEYCEFVGTQFNDVFGFFVSGPGIDGPFDNDAINVASITTLDGIEEVVSINTINYLDNETFYVSNITTTDAQSCNVTHVPTFQELIEYDGFTIPLTASFQVIPCEKYRIRLVLGDVGDDILDSAVFLESNSFDLGEKVKMRAEVPNSEEPIAYENCVDGQFVFTRSSLRNINEDCTVELTISPESEAINGVDFEEIPLRITIPAGDTSFMLPIHVIEDNLPEGPESLKLEFIYDCDCIDPAFSELIINEAEEFSADFEEIVVCADQPFSISPGISGGVSPFDFLWETGVTSETFEDSVSDPTQYTVTVTDFCGNTALGMTEISLQNMPAATLSGIYDFCDAVSAGIPVELEGQAPWEIVYSIDGVEQPPVADIQTSPFYLNTPTAGTYVITAFSDAFCEGTALGSAEVESSFLVDSDLVSPSCPNSYDGRIKITQLDAVSPYSIEWNIEAENKFLLENLKQGKYTLSILDGDGCYYEKTFDLSAASSDRNNCQPIFIPNSFSPNNDGINDVFSVYAGASSELKNIVSLQVYSRWGALMYEQTNFLPDNGLTGWQGDFKGQPVHAGVYVYKIIAVLQDDSSLILSGDITLLR